MALMKHDEGYRDIELLEASPGRRRRDRSDLAGAFAVVLLLSSGALCEASVRVPRHSQAECRAACQDRNLPASCAWLSPSPQRCLKAALKACESIPLASPVQCPLPKDLPACATNHGCPNGALCVDLTCQVVGCGSHNGIADCTGSNRCDGGTCVVAECSAVTANCPKDFHCEPASPPFDAISGTCQPDDPAVGYCSADTDCIALGNLNPTCVRGICTRQVRRLGRCQTHADCSRRCRRGRGSARIARCDAAGQCLCTSCAGNGQCSGLVACPAGRVASCLPSGACGCSRSPQPTTTTSTTTTTTTETTVTSDTATTTTLPANDVCCCTFEVGDSQWHCVHDTRPSSWLCYVPWPECCTADYTICE